MTDEWRPPLLPRWIMDRALRKMTLRDQVRYREEVDAELYFMPFRRQVSLTLSFWRGAAAIRRAHRVGILDQIDGVDSWSPPTSVLCTMSFHHFERKRDPNPETPSSFYLECTRCGKFKDIPWRPFLAS